MTDFLKQAAIIMKYNKYIKKKLHCIWKYKMYIKTHFGVIYDWHLSIYVVLN